MNQLGYPPFIGDSRNLFTAPSLQARRQRIAIKRETNTQNEEL
jgi:hypothetical protein